MWTQGHTEIQLVCCCILIKLLALKSHGSESLCTVIFHQPEPSPQNRPILQNTIFVCVPNRLTRTPPSLRDWCTHTVRSLMALFVRLRSCLLGGDEEGETDSVGLSAQTSQSLPTRRLPGSPETAPAPRFHTPTCHILTLPDTHFANTHFSLSFSLSGSHTLSNIKCIRAHISHEVSIFCVDVTWPTCSVPMVTPLRTTLWHVVGWKCPSSPASNPWGGEEEAEVAMNEWGYCKSSDRQPWWHAVRLSPHQK